MADVTQIVEHMRREPAGIRFAELKKVYEHYFGIARQSGSSHLIFKTPWAGDPRVNIQDASGKAKPYQVLQAIDRLKGQHDEH